MLADKNGATVDHTISVPENMEIESTDICSIVLNLMDNAIEAVSALPPEERRIELEVIDKGGMLAVRVQNPCNGEYKFAGLIPWRIRDQRCLRLFAGEVVANEAGAAVGIAFVVNIQTVCYKERFAVAVNCEEVGDFVVNI